MAHERIDADERTLADFIAYLSAKGTQQEPCEREVFRGKWNGGIAVIMPARGGGWRLTPPAFAAWNTFQTKRATAALRAIARREKRIKPIADRDGAKCFYCERVLKPEEATIEHLLPKAHDGPNNLHNLTLACEPCNKEARDLPVVDKVRLRDGKRERRSA